QASMFSRTLAASFLAASAKSTRVRFTFGSNVVFATAARRAVTPAALISGGEAGPAPPTGTTIGSGSRANAPEAPLAAGAAEDESAMSISARAKLRAGIYDGSLFP